ncbi:MAG: hypothetical protein QOD97_3506, partial [Mycobacterium sp.]|nr:hypothetical protein [Mycobacterium sp.]
VVVTGTAQLPNFSSTNAQGGIKKETFTLLAGPTLTSAQFVRATAMASPATFRPTGQSVLVSVAQADADFDDDSGKTQIRIEAEILGDITLVAVAFQAMILAALP